MPVKGNEHLRNFLLIRILSCLEKDWIVKKTVKNLFKI
jgi:hypothetical protein